MRAERSGEQVEFYSFTGRLATIQTRKQGEASPLHYVACAEPQESRRGLPCNRRVDPSGFCAACNRSGKTAIRLMPRCRFADFADSVWLTTFHEAAVNVVGMTGEEFNAVDNGAEGREGLEAALRAMYLGEPMEVTVKAKLDMYQGEPRPNIACITAVPVDKRARGRKLLAEVREMLPLFAAC